MERLRLRDVFLLFLPKSESIQEGHSPAPPPCYPVGYSEGPPGTVDRGEQSVTQSQKPYLE